MRRALLLAQHTEGMTLWVTKNPKLVQTVKENFLVFLQVYIPLLLLDRAQMLVLHAGRQERPAAVGHAHRKHPSQHANALQEHGARRLRHNGYDG